MRFIVSHLLVFLLTLNSLAYANPNGGAGEGWVKQESSESMILDVYSKDAEKGKDFRVEANIKNLSSGKQVVSELESQLKEIKEKNPNAKVFMKFQVEDSVTKENFKFNPNHFFEFEPKEKGFWDKVDSFLVSKHTSLNSVGLASIRFTANFIAGATVFILGAGHSLQAAAMASGAIAFVSAAFTTFPKIYSDYLLTPRFAHNRVFGKDILGIMTLEIFVYYQVLEFLFSSIGPSILAMFGYVSHISFLSFFSAAIIPVFFVALAQGALEKIFDIERKKETLRRITEFTKNFDYEGLVKGYAKDLTMFNAKMVMISLLTVIGMGLALVGKLYALPTLTYVSTATIALMFVGAVFKKWNSASEAKKKKLLAEFKRKMKLSRMHLAKVFQLPAEDIKALIAEMKTKKSKEAKTADFHNSRKAIGHLKKAIVYAGVGVFNYSAGKLKAENTITENAGSILGDILTSIQKHELNMKPIRCNTIGGSL